MPLATSGLARCLITASTVSIVRRLSSSLASVTSSEGAWCVGQKKPWGKSTFRQKDLPTTQDSPSPCMRQGLVARVTMSRCREGALLVE